MFHCNPKRWWPSELKLCFFLLFSVCAVCFYIWLCFHRVFSKCCVRCVLFACTNYRTVLCEIYKPVGRTSQSPSRVTGRE